MISLLVQTSYASGLELTMVFCYLNGVFRFFEVGSRDHHFAASGIQRSLYHAFKVVRVALFSMIFAPEYGVRKVDADLILL